MDEARAAGQRTLDDLAVGFLVRPGVDRRRMFGSDALAVDGRIFGFVVPGGSLVVKVPARRVDELLALPGAERMQIGRNPAREWVAVPEATGLWEQLLEESYAFVRGA
ncbi:TfoX/Sxy family protein [Nocardioides zeae]|uniref:TfoX/Sxy family protein n=1 Tax=Nocardioides imazamoxiresistens TaxID=3231893 RepID=A0ABU3PUK6_9ACTN|nr:TfoX/Sxy family protein [Nocardioides zeae]MDT9592910.1 TfoX/Sxy family protein [Nocardioides zeae]